MQKDPFVDLLAEYVLDQHPEDVRLKIRAHLDSGCVTCRTELTILQETVHLLPLALPQTKLPAAAKTRLDLALEAELNREQERLSGIQRISHYKLLRRLGIGGMGEVYLAEDTVLGRTAAIKIIRPELAASTERKLRFLREARAAAVLSHPGIATIYEVGEEEGKDFIAMEYVEGRSLSQLLQSGPLPEREVIRIGIQLASALSEAHQRGILHRDLKPENIQIRTDGLVKILDFGLAKFMQNRIEDDYMTTGDRILGTLPYMSPEQIEGKPMDNYSDIFSVGSVLYEAACGKAPFTADLPGSTLENILECKPRPLNSRNPQVSQALNEVIHKCLQREPSRRYPDAKSLQSDLEAIQRGEPIDTKSHAPRGATPALSIAVLYFENLSEEKESDYFRAGMTEDIITELSKVKSWEVRPRTQVVRYKDQSIDLLELGRELKVTHLLQGSIRKAGQRLRISAQLVDAQNASSLWAERYDRDVKDVFEIQSEIAEKIVSALEVHLTKAEKKAIGTRETQNLQAYDDCLRGRDFLFRLSKHSVQSAADSFAKAIKADPEYASAFAGLAQAQAIKISFYGGRGSEIEESIANAQKALALDRDNGQAYAAMGLAYFLKGMSSEAIEACQQAIRLHSHDAFAVWIAGRLHYRLNNYEEAAQHFKRTIELLPDFYTAYTDLAQTYENLQMTEMAIETRRQTVQACRRYLANFPDEPRAHIFLATSYAKLGARLEAMSQGEIAERLAVDDPVMMYNLACLYSLLDESAKAIHWLTLSIRSGRSDVEWMKRDPALDNIRNHPSYLSLLSELDKR